MEEHPVPPLAEAIKQATMRRQPRGMFQRFSDEARQAVNLAQEEARLLRHDRTGTEHLLLGLLYQGEGIAAKALESLGVSREGLRSHVVEITGLSQGSAAGPMPFTPRAKKAMELSLREALGLGRHYIGTEHLLLGLLHERENVAEQVLARLGVTTIQVRERILRLIHEREQAGREVALTIPAVIADTADQLARVQRQKEAAFDAGELDRAAVLRDQEKQLLTAKLRLERQWASGAEDQTVMVQGLEAENQRLRNELDRVHDLLRQQGTAPESGTPRTG